MIVDLEDKSTQYKKSFAFKCFAVIMLINLFLCFKNLVDQIDKGIAGAGGGNGSGSSTLDRSKLQPLNLSGLVYLIYNFLFYNHVSFLKVRPIGFHDLLCSL